MNTRSPRRPTIAVAAVLAPLIGQGLVAFDAFERVTGIGTLPELYQALTSHEDRLAPSRTKNRHLGSSSICIAVSGYRCDVLIDDVPMPGMPVDCAPVSAGDHKLTLLRSGFIPRKFSIHVNPDEVVSLSTRLYPNTPSGKSSFDAEIRSQQAYAGAWLLGLSGLLVGTLIGGAVAHHRFQRREDRAIPDGIWGIKIMASALAAGWSLGLPVAVLTYLAMAVFQFNVGMAAIVAMSAMGVLVSFVYSPNG